MLLSGCMYSCKNKSDNWKIHCRISKNCGSSVPDDIWVFLSLQQSREEKATADTRLWPEVDGTVYITTPLLAVFVFAAFILKKGNSKILLKIGRDYSTVVYIVHLMVYLLQGMVFKRLGAYNISMIWAPVICFLNSLLLAVVCDWIKNTHKAINDSRS